MSALKDEVGNRYGRLCVLVRAANTSNGQAVWWTKCDCGVVCAVQAAKLRNGHTQSCGCINREVSSKRLLRHGQAKEGRKTRAYNAWIGMKERIRSDPTYGNVALDPSWAASFEAFYAELGDCPPKYELDRIDNHKGYVPGNCRWVDEYTQAYNRRDIKLNMDAARKIRADPRPNPIIAKEYGVGVSIIWGIKHSKNWKEKENVT